MNLQLENLMHFENYMALFDHLNFKSYVMSILYIKATCLSVCVGNAWKILPVTARDSPPPDSPPPPRCCCADSCRDLFQVVPMILLLLVAPARIPDEISP